MERKIGIISGKEVFSEDLINRINSKNVGGVTAEKCRIYETRIFEPCPYRLIIDRASHYVEYYRAYLKNAALTGSYIINNPFWFAADDKFDNYSLARKLGVTVPRTICLPSRSYVEGVVPEDLQNLAFPLDWNAIISYIGLPAIVKPYDGYGWRDVTKINSIEELFKVYNESGEAVMLLQEFIEFEHYVRTFVIAKKYILPVKYDPHNRQYIIDHKHLTDEQGERIIHDCIKLNEVLGYDLNTVEFAIRDGIPYAIDFMNPVPDARPESITPIYYEWLVEHVARAAVEIALSDLKTPCEMKPISIDEEVRNVLYENQEKHVDNGKTAIRQNHPDKEDIGIPRG